MSSPTAPGNSRDVGIRRIEPCDAAELAVLIRTVMSAYDLDHEGSSFRDPEIDFMSEAYSGNRFAYFVAESHGVLLGGAGIGPLRGGDDDTCELRKMYLVSGARGKGLGKALLEACLEAARGAGYRRCYLETIEAFEVAHAMYRRAGFEPLCAPLGATGHSNCHMWFAKEL